VKTLFTICLWPVAFVGAGLIVSFLWHLFHIGWKAGKQFFNRIHKIKQP